MYNRRDEPLRVALLGAGTMGSLHARVVTQAQNAVLVAVHDQDEKAARAVAERYNTTWGKGPDSFDDVDAVIVATPTDTHFEWGMHAIDASKPTLIEKPLSDNIDHVRRLIEAARHASIPLACGFVERFNPAVKTALEIADQPVQLTSVRHSPYLPRIKTGVAADLLIHDIDLAIRFMGSEPVAVSGSLSYVHPDSDPGAEDIAVVNLRFANRALATLSASRIWQKKVREFTIASLNFMVEVDLLRRDVTVYRHVLNQFLNEDGPGYRQETIIDIPTIVDGREPLAAQLDHFYALARGTADAGAELETLLPPHEVLHEAIATAVPGTRAAELNLAGRGIIDGTPA